MATPTCPDCLTGSVKEGTPVGTVSTLHGLDTYIARPEKTPKGVVVIIPDLFGWEISNSRLLADSYAKKGGFLVYLPDFMKGNSPPSYTMHALDGLLAPASWSTTIVYKPFYLLQTLSAVIPFLWRNSEKVIKPRVWDFFSGIRNDPATSNLKVGAAGFCWGGKYAILLAHEQSMIDVAFTAHPSKMKFPDEWDAVRKPLSVAIGDVDMGIKIDMVKDIKALLEKKEDVPCELTIYPGAKHGFAVRADPKDEGQTKSAGEAEEQALTWFTKWFTLGAN
ncbi:Tropolone synthesis I [Hyphodiscus hymeniophilus]|uniref:Tropolone synthesis I n=1 Tax=Hyphodiscus hymeniophilus TaxID=353542 RepID=A0A9P6VKG6_9HELO|nr:Tropolone synthesis I [Hyphodiscus hymeniophilus]